MKIAILSHEDVANWYAATLMERGHKITIGGGGAIHATGLKRYLECDGCLLLGDDPDLLEIAYYMEASGKKIWRELSEIPVAQSSDSQPTPFGNTPSTAKEERTTDDEEKSIKCVGIHPAPARRWWVVLEYNNHSAAVESTHDAHGDAVQRAKELAAEHKVRWVQR
jgi:hypothetical protein